MITLDINDRCHQCNMFRVKSETATYRADDLMFETNTIIKCENEELCEKLIKYLKKQKD